MKEQIDRSMRMLSQALEMEEKGRAFYEKAAAACRSEPGKEIFRTLMNDEVLHMKRIKAIYESLGGRRAWTGDWKAYATGHGGLTTIFREMARRYGADIQADAGDIEALDIGIDFEKKSIDYYRKHVSTASDELEKAFIEQMIAEERDHFTALSDMKLYLSDPASWLREREHGGLDGG